MGVLGHVLHEERDGLMDGLRGDQVVVVEDNRDLVLDVGQLVDQSAHHHLDGREIRRTQRGQDPLADPLFDGL